MSLTLKPLHRHFVAEAGGLDLRETLPEAEIAAIVAAMDRYAVLVFRDQPLDEHQQMAFTRRFGPLDLGLKKLGNRQSRFQSPELADISNVDEHGRVAARENRKIVSNLANQLWHSDSSFQKPAARYSLLSAHVLPDAGGETEFADERAAFDALPEKRKRELEGLEAEHYVLHSRLMLGDTDYTEAQKNALPPVTWPIVRTHPSGRRALFIGVHARSVVGMTVPEGRVLLMDLLEHATKSEFVYRHEWRVGDLVMWDNRCTLHRGRHYDLSQRRELRRSTTEDAMPLEAVA